MRATRRADAFRILATGVALAMGACAAPPSSGPAPVQEIMLSVENQGFADATITAVAANGTRQRLGVVPGNGRRQFTFRWSELDIRIEARLLAGGRYLGEPLQVRPGDTIEVMLQPHLFRSP